MTQPSSQEPEYSSPYAPTGSTPPAQQYTQETAGQFQAPFQAQQTGLTAQDLSHLKTLSILYYVLGTLIIVGGLLGILWAIVWIIFVLPQMATGRGAPPPGFQEMMIVIMSISVLFSLVISGGFAAMMFIAASGLKQQRKYTMCFVAGCIACLNMPLGTVLGIFTILVLQRPQVKAAFELNKL